MLSPILEDIEKMFAGRVDFRRVDIDQNREEAAKVKGLVIGGRLGEYRYYDMDQSVGQALAAADQLKS